MNSALLRLILAQVAIHACMTGMRMAAPLLALKEGFSAAAVGMLLALFALTHVFRSLPAGRYADRKGLRKPIAIAVVMAVLGGVVLNIEETASAIQDAVNQAQEKSGVTFSDVYVGIAGQHIRSIRNSGKWTMSIWKCRTSKSAACART